MHRVDALSSDDTRIGLRDGRVMGCRLRFQEPRLLAVRGWAGR